MTRWRDLRVTLAWVVSFASVLMTACGGGGADTSSGPSTTAIADRPAAEGTATSASCETAEPQALEPEIVRTVDHDATSYTQGLVMFDGLLFESAGRYDSSRLRSIDPSTGDELDSVALADEVFGEGLAVGENGELVQLTWKDGVAYRWNPGGFELVGEFSYEGEGWGLTTLEDGTLVMSDGSDVLTLRDPGDFSVIATHRIDRGVDPVDQLNELEFDGTSIWANRYETDEIVRIDPACWAVTGVADMSAVRAAATKVAEEDGTRIDVTNGIAQVPGTDRFLVTGKWWPTMYEVTFEPV